MKQEFNWYFKPSDDEVDEIWKNGILTVDANVLLDLYRYHESTRTSILESLKNFEGTLWVSRQASEEFFRNRNKVIMSSNKTFKDANGEVDKLQSTIESTVNQLKGNRIIPEDVANQLLKDILPGITTAKDKISEIKGEHPNYLVDDTLLEKVTTLFNGSVGKDFSEQEYIELVKEAEERKNKKIPPGYLDSDKDGDRPYGDFLLWRQILNHAKENSKPILFVTSERKEDWWEKISGKTIGPRMELLREAEAYSGQRVMVYQTDRFLEFSSQRKGQAVNEKAVDEIRAIDTLRSEKEKTVELISQSIYEADEFYNSGEIVIALTRPISNFTCSGMLNPLMVDVPNINVNLVSSPTNIPACSLKGATGVNSNFNIHLISIDLADMLPIGEYIFKYEARCEPEVIQDHEQHFECEET
ncbi:MAG: PIN domain-containing protein [Colwellia sp.]|nr:PIN domain-containing protein [Colwellia sp.]